VPEPPGDDLASRVSSEPTVFVCDDSPEGERVGAVLRARGYSVADVPHDRMLERISVQQPSLVICEVDSEGGLEVLRQLGQASHRPRIHTIALGDRTHALGEHAGELRQITVSTFERPVDTYALLRRVEALLGAPRALPSVMPSSRWSTPPDSSGVPAGSSASSRPSVRGRVLPSSMRASETPGPDSITAGRPLPQPGLSPELEDALRQAELKLGLPSSLPSVGPGRLTPEEELEALLPADILAALDEPLEADDEDDEELESSARGSEASRAGSDIGSAAGSGTANTPMQARPQAATPDTGDVTGAPEPPARPNVGEGVPTAGGSDLPPSEPSWNGPRFATLPARPSTFPPVLPSIQMVERLPTARPGSEPRRTPPDPVIQRRGHVADSDVPAEPVPGAPAMPVDMQPSIETPTPPPATVSSTRPPHRRHADSEEPSLDARSSPAPEEIPEVPPALGVGDAVAALARLVRARYSGAVAFEDVAGIHRVVFREGDFVTAASGAEQESLLAFLVQRGALAPEVAARLGRRIPPFGRHAGAALIAHGHLRQDELWPVLRAHAEWLIGHTLTIERGALSLEREVPARLKSEPAVFGGATGAEVLVEVVRRVVPPEVATERLGSPDARVGEGQHAALLGECGLPEHELKLVERGRESTLGSLLEKARAPDFAAVVYALVELGVLERSLPEVRPAPARSPRRAFDELDEAAQRARILARKALVEEGDYFAILGVSRSATSYDIRRAYLDLKREFEPARALTTGTADLRDDVDLILEVLDEAYDILHDQNRRERYRRAIEVGPG
jgi:hypothetical protein